MIRVPAIDRRAIDQWPIAGSGLSVRVTTCAARAGMKTVADLRAARAEDVLALRHFGVTSLRHLRRFLRQCDRIAAGQLVFRDANELAGELLNGPQWDVIRSRYGLLREELRASRDFYTLQEIGNRTNLTRERVRQVEALALKRLASRFAEACLGAWRAGGRAFLEARGGVADFASFAEWPGDGTAGGLNPCALMLLLADLRPDEWIQHRDGFSLYGAGVLHRIEAQALDRLRRTRGPVPAAALRAAQGPGRIPDGMTDEALARVLERMPDVLALADGSFLHVGHVAVLLADAVPPGPPVHCEAVHAALNARLRPGSRRGLGFVVRALGASTLFVRPRGGLYTRKR